MQGSHRLVACGAALAALFPGTIFAQGAAGTYPSKPVLVISGEAAGGPNGNEARRHLQKISTLLGQQFVLEHKVGAGTTIGTGYVAKAAPDGYTLLSTVSSFTVFPALYLDLPFDTLRDFAPISQVSKKPTIFLAHPSFPAKTFVEYLAYAKTNPGKINLGTSGQGSVSHLAGAWVHSATKTKVTYVHYKVDATKKQDFLAGRVDVIPTSLVAAIPMMKAGKARALAIMNDERSKLYPSLKTVAEQGIPGYNYASWLGFSAPAGTPAAIIKKLSEGFAKGVKSPDVAKPLEATGSVMIGSTPEQFRKVIVTETARWKKVAQENGIKLEK